MKPVQGETLIRRLEQGDVHGVLERHGVRVAYLFGSRLRGEADGASDLDVAVLLSDSLPPLARFDAGGRIGRELEALLGLPTDVVVLNDAGPTLLYEAVALGQPIYCPRPGDSIDLERRIRGQYDDHSHAQRFWNAERRERLGLTRSE